MGCTFHYYQESRAFTTYSKKNPYTQICFDQNTSGNMCDIYIYIYTLRFMS